MIPSKPLADMSLLDKLIYYSKQQGTLHASLSGVGRKVPIVWRIAGPRLTSSAYGRYIAQTRPSERVLNLGGGSHRIAGAFNVDIDPRADAYVDITKPLPFPDAAFSSIFCEEVIEHIDRERGLAMLRECYRILQPGGVLRITTPDLGYFASRVSSDDMKGEEINRIFYCHGHRHIYSRKALFNVMVSAGFEAIYFSSYKDIGSCLGKYDSHADRFEHLPDISQYCEAIRPLENTT